MTPSLDSEVTVKPIVTIAIIFYNAMPYFPMAVKSCLAQTFKDFELLLVDDGSTDGSLEYAQSLTDPRVRVTSDGMNRKLNVRLNESIRLARGRYYARMDADDLMFPCRIEHQITLLQKYGDCFLGGAAVVIDQENRILGARGLSPRHPRSMRDAKHLFIHPTVIAPTRMFLENPYSENFLFHRSQDAELWTRVWRRVPCMHDARPVLFYRDGGSLGVENYLGTSLGICSIGYRAADMGKFAKAWWCARELLKCVVVVTVAIFGLQRYLLRQRNKPVSPGFLADIHKARKALDI